MDEFQLPSPHPAPTTQAELISSPGLICEEYLAEYDPERWYPAHIGEVLDEQFEIVAKLGFGNASTAWLCRDTKNNDYVTVKIFRRDDPQILLERCAQKHLRSMKSRHPGQQMIRIMLGSFMLQSKHGVHHCMIFDPMGPTIGDVRQRFPSYRLPYPLIKFLLAPVLHGLDYLHTRPLMVHADINEGNIMIPSESQAFFDEVAQAERDYPCKRKIEGDRVVYAMRICGMPQDPGPATICDFGQAKNCAKGNLGQAVGDLYRSPEMVLHIPWREKIDIWAIGCLAWDMYEGKHLFKHPRAYGPDGISTTDGSHLGVMIALMGMPPKGLLEGGTESYRYFDDEGSLRSSVHVPDISLDSELTRPVETEDDARVRKLFLDFIRSCLQWRPEDRAKARELFAHPFLKTEMKAITEEDEEGE